MYAEYFEWDNITNELMVTCTVQKIIFKMDLKDYVEAAKGCVL